MASQQAVIIQLAKDLRATGVSALLYHWLETTSWDGDYSSYLLQESSTLQVRLLTPSRIFHFQRYILAVASFAALFYDALLTLPV